jgi:branched-chain amino acid transport system substrate-binding protein
MIKDSLMFVFSLLILSFIFPDNTTVMAADTIKIGVAVARSGDLASYGIPTAHAVELIAEEVNAKGGILGKRIELFIEDDMCKPELATNTATKLISKGAKMIIGHTCSGPTKSALGIYRDADVICISPSATNPPLTQNHEYPNFYRTIAPDDAQARLEVDYALDTLKLKKIAILHDKGDYGKGLAEFAKGFIDKSGKAQVVLFEGITAGAVDYSAVVQKIKRSGADGVIFGGYYPEASKIIMQMRTKRIDACFISDDGVKEDSFINLAGKDAEGVYATGPKDTTKNKLAVKAIEDHRKKYGTDPGVFFLNAAAAMQVLINAVEKAGGTDYKAVSGALKSEYVETPLGRISFDKNGDAIGVGFSVYQVKNGRYVEIN